MSQENPDSLDIDDGLAREFPRKKAPGCSQTLWMTISFAIFVVIGIVITFNLRGCQALAFDGDQAGQSFATVLQWNMLADGLANDGFVMGGLEGVTEKEMAQYVGQQIQFAADWKQFEKRFKGMKAGGSKQKYVRGLAACSSILDKTMPPSEVKADEAVTWEEFRRCITKDDADFVKQLDLPPNPTGEAALTSQNAKGVLADLNMFFTLLSKARKAVPRDGQGPIDVGRVSEASLQKVTQWATRKDRVKSLILDSGADFLAIEECDKVVGADGVLEMVRGTYSAGPDKGGVPDGYEPYAATSAYDPYRKCRAEHAAEADAALMVCETHALARPTYAAGEAELKDCETEHAANIKAALKTCAEKLPNGDSAHDKRAWVLNRIVQTRAGSSLAFMPKFDSRAMHNKPCFAAEGPSRSCSDDGTLLLWNHKLYELGEGGIHYYTFLLPSKQFGATGAVCAHLRRRQGSAEFLFCGSHLWSGAAQEARVRQATQINEHIQNLAQEHPEAVVILAMDANIQNPKTENSEDPYDVDAFPNAKGNAEVPLGEAVLEALKPMALYENPKSGISVNKMRSTYTEQPWKAGEYEMHNIDWVLVQSPAAGEPDLVRPVVDSRSLQTPVDINEAYGHTLPSEKNPSDHLPVRVHLYTDNKVLHEKLRKEAKSPEKEAAEAEAALTAMMAKKEAAAAEAAEAAAGAASSDFGGKKKQKWKEGESDEEEPEFYFGAKKKKKPKDSPVTK